MTHIDICASNFQKLDQDANPSMKIEGKNYIDATILSTPNLISSSYKIYKISQIGSHFQSVRDPVNQKPVYLGTCFRLSKKLLVRYA